ncbi:MAG: biotin--[acetyl-CoA-carboxylase] ligase [Crenarchaeota archaeon]|nr:biotin--[acetyl-CoA-carboxylase] ligase [Thermoproteota archaeon]
MFDYSRSPLVYTRRLRLIEAYDKTPSTMDAEPPLLPAAVLAAEQTRGRGRTGPWASPQGGAWLTVHIQAQPPQGYPVAVAGCLAERLNRLLGRRILEVKWPNDIVDVGCRKLAGILVEHRGGRLRVGIGVNVHNPPPTPHAASLAQHGYQGGIAEAALQAVEAALEALEEPRRCIAHAARLDHLRGAEVEVEAPHGTVHGVALGVTAEGLLAVEAPAGTLELACCHVKSHRHPASASRPQPRPQPRPQRPARGTRAPHP